MITINTTLADLPLQGRSKYFIKCAFLFNNFQGDPFLLTPWQEEIFKAVYDPETKRLAIKTTTQYGKSEVVSMALISIAIARREKILIVAPSEGQASIIMDKVIDHLFDHPLISSMVNYKANEFEQLKKEMSSTRITFKNGSEIFMLTANADNLKKNARNLMGFGATIVVVDESSLLPDSIYSKILRMVGGVENGKIIQLGNPFENNHFGRCFGGHQEHGKFQAKRYLCISVDWKMALKEKRLKQEFLDEARDDMTPLEWTIMYEVSFPEGGNENGLIPRAWIELAINQPGCEGEFRQTGLDVARFGKDKTILAFRKGGEIQAINQTEQMDTMEVTGWTTPQLKKYKPDRHCTDVIGLGAGVHDRLDELQGEDNNEEWSDCDLIPLNVGESPVTKTAKAKFYNLRAQVFWHLRFMFKPDEKTGRSLISIPNDPELVRQLEELRYKYSSERKIKMESKDEMKKRLGFSPDKADAVAMACWDVENDDDEPQLFIATG